MGATTVCAKGQVDIEMPHSLDAELPSSGEKRNYAAVDIIGVNRVIIQFTRTVKGTIGTGACVHDSIVPTPGSDYVINNTASHNSQDSST